MIIFRTEIKFPKNKMKRERKEKWNCILPLVFVAISATFWKASRNAPVATMVALKKKKKKNEKWVNKLQDS